MSIAILIPICSRGYKYKNIDEIPLFNFSIPSILKTVDNSRSLTFYIAHDNDDAFYIDNRDHLYSKLLKLNICFKLITIFGCQHAPAWAWNKMADYAKYNNHDYYFQIGDDIIMQGSGWDTRFINALKNNNNIGVVGPCNIINYHQRVDNGRDYVIENAFVHKTHLEIFDTFFHPSIKNWYCDDWITQSYLPFYREIFYDLPCVNSIVAKRYDIINCCINEYVDKSRAIIKKFIQGHLL